MESSPSTVEGLVPWPDVAGELTFSSSVTRILENAAAATNQAIPHDPISTSYIFAGIWQSGQTPSAGISNDFVRQLATQRAAIESVLSQHLGRFGALHFGSSPLKDQKLTENAAAMLRHAEQLRKEAGSDKYIALRHLLAAMVTFESLKQTQLMVRFKIARLDVKVLRDALAEVILTHAPAAEHSVWRSILGFDERATISSDDAIEAGKIINALKDGSDEQRSNALTLIKNLPSSARIALGQQLRELIGGDYIPRPNGAMADAPRDLNKIPSIRSWMLSGLIWADFNHTDTRRLLLRHLDSHYEANSTVRFWTLAGIYQRDNRDFLASALRVVNADPALEVSRLAKAIGGGNDGAVQKEFLSVFNMTDTEAIWTVLRVLRIVPIPSLAENVLDLVLKYDADSTTTYDGLYALVHPDMAKSVARFVPGKVTVAAFVDLIVVVTRESNRNAARNFVSVLRALDRKEVERALTNGARDQLNGEAAKSLLQFLQRLAPTDLESGDSSVAGHHSDAIRPGDRDYLDIRQDVETLTAVMLSRDVQPPLAIGLFGDWGTGKSYFMKSMQAKSGELTGRNGNFFCRHVASIEFNAWHYIDTNLWASLISHILTKLAEFVLPNESPAEQQRVLLKQLETAKAVVEEAESERKETAKQIVDREKDLELLRTKRKEKEVQLNEIRASDLVALIKDTNEAKDLQSALKELGMPTVIDNFLNLERVVSDARSTGQRMRTLFLAIVDKRNLWLWLAMMLLLVVLVPVGIPFVCNWLRTSEFTANAVTVITEIVAGIGGFATMLHKGVAYVNTRLQRVEEAKKKVEELLAKKREERKKSQKELEIEDKVVGLRAKEQEAGVRLKVATDRVAALEERIRSIVDSLSLARFLSDRTKSEDYRRHLGLITTIRHDLESLTKSLSPENAANNTRPVERIVLYIDDLDRCPTNKVMEVLQAVHLLLAYPLFVVVVGVDPRWLLHSLESTYPIFVGPGWQNMDLSQDAHRLATPQNYLEKIFQIPFSLRKMTPQGYSRLVSSLLTPPPKKDAKAAIKDPIKQEIPQTAHPSQTSESPIVAVQTNSPHQPEVGPVPAQKANVPDASKLPEEEHIVQERALIIQPWEAAFAADNLFALLPTPRAVKRFSNLYRLLKAPLSQGRLAAFEGTEDEPGEFRIPMLLLAMLVGLPQESSKLFRKLYEGEQLFELLTDPKKWIESDDQVAAFYAHAGLIVGRTDFPKSRELIKEWLIRVSRFSFDSGRGLLIDKELATAT